MTAQLASDTQLEGLSLVPKTFERIERLKKLNIVAKPGFTAERALIFTRVYKETEGEPAAIRRAKAVAASLREIEIDINQYELLVGREAVRPRCAQSYPELWGEDFYEELGNVQDREKSPLQVSEAHAKALLEEVLPYWRGKSLGTMLVARMPRAHKEFWYLDPDAAVPKEAGFPGTIQGLYNNTVDETYSNYYNILNYGFRGMRELAEKSLRETDISASLDELEKSYFREAVVITYQAVSDFILRYATLARDKAKAETDTKRKQELEVIAEVCEWLSENAPRTFREALQAVQFVQTIMKVEVLSNAWSMGRLDQYMYPFYKRDIEEGKITRDEALELLQCLWVKCSDYVMPRSESGAEFEGGYSVWFNVNIGGVKPDGSDGTNELSYLCLDATAAVQLYQPDICVKTWRRSPNEFLHYAVQVAALSPTVKFYNDDVLVPAIMTLSEGRVTLQEARDFSNLACVEVGIVEKTSFANTTPFASIAASVELALNNGVSRLYKRRFGPETGDPRNFKSMDEVVEAFRRQFEHSAIMTCAANNLGDDTRLRNIYLPFTSGSRVDLIERGYDMCADMDKLGEDPYNWNFFVLTGFGDAAESLNVINKLVFEDRKITMAELIDALDNDFEGPYERIRNMIIYEVPHYGNDHEPADRWAEVASQIISEETYDHYKTSTGHLCHPNLQSTTMNVAYGSYTGALPTGKKAGKPIADASGPIYGFDRSGPTAVVRSVGTACCRASHEIGMPNLNLFNLRLSPELIDSEGGVDNWVALVRTYFDAGGTHIQFNTVRSETLREAQTRPEAYPDLIVRVAGYAAYFTELGRDVQDDIIDRTVHTGW